MLDFIKSLLKKAGFGNDAIERIENLETVKPIEKPAKKQTKKPAAKKETAPKPVATTAPAPKPGKKKTRKKVSYNMNAVATPKVEIPNLNAMTKEKIVSFAKENGLELEMSMTKKNMIAEVKSKLS